MRGQVQRTGMVFASSSCIPPTFSSTPTSVAEDTFVANQPALESAILPRVQDLYLAMKELAEY